MPEYALTTTGATRRNIRANKLNFTPRMEYILSYRASYRTNTPVTTILPSTNALCCLKLKQNLCPVY